MLKVLGIRIGLNLITIISGGPYFSNYIKRFLFLDAPAAVNRAISSFSSFNEVECFSPFCLYNYETNLICIPEATTFVIVGRS